MKEDWKDALSILRGSLNEPEEENKEIEIEEIKPQFRQKNPLNIVTDRKGRNGKTATIIEGFEIPEEEVADIAKKLKQKLGVGGSVRNSEILIQGDFKQQLKKYLQEMKFKIK